MIVLKLCQEIDARLGGGAHDSLHAGLLGIGGSPEPEVVQDSSLTAGTTVVHDSKNAARCVVALVRLHVGGLIEIVDDSVGGLWRRRTAEATMKTCAPALVRVALENLCVYVACCYGFHYLLRLVFLAISVAENSKHEIILHKARYVKVIKNHLFLVEITYFTSYLSATKGRSSKVLDGLKIHISLCAALLKSAKLTCMF